jgi:hypothetical protein
VVEVGVFNDKVLVEGISLLRDGCVLGSVSDISALCLQW